MVILSPKILASGEKATTNFLSTGRMLGLQGLMSCQLDKVTSGQDVRTKYGSPAGSNTKHRKLPVLSENWLWQ